MSGSAQQKYIRWDGSSWQVDDLELRVVQILQGVRKPIQIETDQITIQDEKSWLAMGIPYQKQDDADKTIVVPLKVRDDAKIAPPGAANPSVSYVYERLFQPGQSKPAETVLRDKIKVKIRFKPPVAQLAGAALGSFLPPMGSSMVQDVVGRAIPYVTVLGETTYEVVPPQAKWSVMPHEPIKLRKDSYSPFTVCANEFPEGWLSGVQVVCGVSDKTANLKPLVAIAGDDCAGPNTMTAGITVTDVVPCYVWVPAIPDTEDPEKSDTEFEVILRVSSPYLGVQESEILKANARALDIAVYYKDKAVGDYEWTDASRLSVLANDKAVPGPHSLLEISLRHTKDWPDPPVSWCLDTGAADGDATGGGLGDQIRNPLSLQATYTAPLKDPWVAAQRPKTRRISCRVGPGAGATPEEVPEHTGIFRYAVMSSSVEVCERVRKAHVRVRVRPRDLNRDEDGNARCQGAAMTLLDPRTIDCFVKDLDLFINLES